MRKLKLNINRKYGICLCTFALIVSQGGITNSPIHNEKVNKNKPSIINYVKFQDYLKTPITLKDNSPPIMPDYDINLSPKYQLLIFELCQQNNLSYGMALAIFFCESWDFKLDLRHRNTNGTVDNSCYQINSRFLKDYWEYGVKYCGLSEKEKFNPMNPEQNIRAGIGYMVYLKNYWVEQGINNDVLDVYISNSFHSGLNGFINHIKNTGIVSRGYSKKVYKYKKILETSHTLRG